MEARRAVLIVDHGSRRESANTLVEELARRVRARRPDLHVEHAHMEITEPSFPTAVAACVAAGAVEIVVHPYFLADGRHTTETIPALVAEARTAHPHIRFEITPHLGLDDRLVDLILDRIDHPKKRDG